MKKRWMEIGLMILMAGAVLGIFVGCGEDWKEENELLKEQLDELQKEINTLTINAQFAGKESEALEEDIDQLQEELDELTSADYVDPEDVTQLEERVNQVASSAQSNEENISQLDAAANSNTVSISQIRAQVDGVDSTLRSSEESITELNTLVSGVIDGKVIKAEEFQLVDETGKGRAYLYTWEGQPRLVFYDEEDDYRALLGADSSGGFLATYNENGELAALIRDGSLSFYNESGGLNSSLIDTTLKIYGEDGNLRVSLGVAPGGGQLEIYDENGEVTTTLDDFGLDTFFLDTFIVSQDMMGLYDENGDLSLIYASSLDGKPSLVYMDAEGRLWNIPLESTLTAQGSGFLLSESGLVVTNYHVIEGSTNIEVVFPQTGEILRADVELADETNDLAILQLANFNFSDIFDTGIPYSIGPSSSVNLGQEVFTLGFPLGDILGESTKFSTGTVSSLYGIENDPVLFQISNPIQPGNSGGPLFSNEGELIGIIVSSLNARYFYEIEDFIPQNVNFAIKSDYLSNLISMLPEMDEIEGRENQLTGKPLEEQIELLTPFVVVVNAQ